MIQCVFDALRKISEPQSPLLEKRIPHVSPKKTIAPDFLISLEDGRHYKSLKRHLSARGLTPEEYRKKWNLPSNYPMVAASYAARRSEIAKQLRKP